MADESLTKNEARGEARSFYDLFVGGGESLEGIRRLIAVDPKSEALLRAFSREHPGEAQMVEQVLAIVLEFFDALLEAAAPADVPDIKADMEPASEQPAAVGQPVLAPQPDTQSLAAD